METSREFDERFGEAFQGDGVEGGVLRAENKLRNQLAEDYLRPRLKDGDKLRATKAECGSKEANFIFSHWEGGWIVSTGAASIAPGSVYSVNGDVLRFDVKGKVDAKPQDQKQPEKEAAAKAADPVADQAAGDDQVKVAVGADASPDGSLDAATGKVLPDDGSGTTAPEGESEPKEAGSPLAATAMADEPSIPASAGSSAPGPEASGAAHRDDPDLEARVLTQDMALWAAYRGQRAIARALADDQDAPCLSLGQCEKLAGLLRKSPEASKEALEMQLKLDGVPLKLAAPLGTFLLDVFGGAFRSVQLYQDLKKRLDAPAPETNPVRIPEAERAMKLVPEPLALSKTAQKLKERGR